VIAVASEQAQNTTLLGYLAVLGLVAVFVFKKPAAIITMGACAYGAFRLMTEHVAKAGNTINTDAAAHTGPILVGALVGLAIHVTLAKRWA
jgi:membrane associated rhomboid family serine protease